ncbi:Holliday junction resolvase RuvX [Buchnera aphidicola (Formosaphis micheliae)]
MIILSFDFGTTNIGVAVGQELTHTANALTSIRSKNGVPNWYQIKKIIEQWKPKYIIVGLPLNIDGTNQNITIKARKFAKSLQKMSINVKLHDERLSTVEAKSILFQKGGFKSLTKNNIDSFSAVLILESWFLNKNKL